MDKLKRKLEEARSKNKADNELVVQQLQVGSFALPHEAFCVFLNMFPLVCV